MNSPPKAESAQQAIQEALALHRQGKVDLAMQRYVAILQQDPQNIDALYYVAVLAIQDGQFAEGQKVIQRALDVGPPQARLHNLKGQAHLRQNQDEDAFNAFTHAIETDPSFPDAYGNRATLLAEMGRLEEAIADYDSALELRPNNAEDLCNRAGALANLGQFEAALAGFDRAIVLMPRMAPAHFNRADVLLRLNRLGEALRDYDNAIALYPEYPAAHANRGKALEAMGRIDEAKASYARAAELDPKTDKAD